MQNKPKQCIIIGGGNSVREGIDKGLWQALQNKFTVGLNFSYRFVDSTFTSFIDGEVFYAKYQETLKLLPLMIGKYTDQSNDVLMPNTILLPPQDKQYDRTLATGVWKGSLTGIFGLSLAIYLLDIGEIFLLGYDLGAKELDKETSTSVSISNNIHVTGVEITEQFLNMEHKGNYVKKHGQLYTPATHWYQDEMNHRGIGKIQFYYLKDTRTKEYKYIDCFRPYQIEKKIKIYNVSMISRIPESIFPKITYDEMFKKLNRENFQQDTLREWVRGRIDETNCKKTVKKV